LGEIVSYLSGKLFLSNTEICCRNRGYELDGVLLILTYKKSNKL
jgi:hypothetical protein